MKKYIYLLIAFTCFLFSSCNSAIDTAPTGEVKFEKVFETTDNAAYAVNGLNRLTAFQYMSQGLNGEGTIKLYYGEYPSDAFVKDLPGWAAIINSLYMANKTSIYLYYPWYYYYRLIGDANVILDNVDSASGPEADKKIIKARALCYRAYSYFMLSQLYCNRWTDSANGTTQGLILRTKSDTPDNYPFSTLAEVYNQIYTDLDNAINYFTTSDSSSSTTTNYYQMTIDAAYAIYARAALTKNDFATAATMAPLARQNHPLMSNTDYTSGFNSPNSEWIWGSYGSADQNLYYYSYHAYIGYDARTSIVRSYPMSITKELYQKLPTTDIRRDLWYYPGNDTTSPGTITDATVKAKIRSSHSTLLANSVLSNYMHFKFAVAAQPGVGCIPHFRSAEMYLIEAEALVRQNNGSDAKAQALMVALNKTSGRDASYTCTTTGDDLLAEIATYRAIELWGEGFRWFDLKRTGKSMVRTARSAGGSYISSLAVTNNPSANSGWVWSIPSKETDYNTLEEPTN